MAINPEWLFTEAKINLWEFAKESSITMIVMNKKIALKMFINEDVKYAILLYNEAISRE
jgi:hypothetical protein